MGSCQCARLETKDGEALPLLGVRVRGDLRGLVFEARVEQRFRNASDSNAEVIYTFPLPLGAVLLGVEVLLGDEHLTGTVMEKKLAEAGYEDAISDGNAAIMLEKLHDRSYCLNLGNLKAKESCSITLRYVQVLQFEQRGLRLVIPSVIAPRYGDSARDGGLLPHQVSAHSLTAEYRFEVDLRLYGDLARGRVTSPSHPVAISFGNTESERVLSVSLSRPGTMDRDFVLVIDRLEHDSVGVMAKDCVDPEGVAVLASFCPQITLAQEAGGTQVKILVDCSGSMAGDSIEAAKRALQAIVLQFADGERFSLSRFGNTVEHRARGLWKANDTTRQAAQRWVAELQADLGGTEMEGALTSTFALAQNGSSDVLLVTDGEISAIDRTIESAKTSGHRVFVVGIGSSPAENHLRRLAAATGGACDFVAPGEAVEPAVLRMFARLRSPRLADLSLVWSGGAAPQWVSPLLPAIFDGDTVNIFAWFRNSPAGEVRLLGRRSQGAVAEEIGCTKFDGPLETGDTLSRIVASERCQSEGSADLAVAYQLITDSTNFLLIHEREGEVATDMPCVQKVPQMIPAGWGSTGSVMFSPARSYTVTKTRAYLCESDSALGPMDARYWSASEHYQGLTPLGVAEALLAMPRTAWPKSFRELRQLGLGGWVVEWLEFSMARRGGMSFSEVIVVEAFLYVMSWPSIRAALGGSQPVTFGGTPTREMFDGLLSGAAKLQVDVRLVEAMLLALDGMTANSWPDCVYSLADGGEARPGQGNWKPQYAAGSASVRIETA